MESNPNLTPQQQQANFNEAAAIFQNEGETGIRRWLNEKFQYDFTKADDVKDAGRIIKKLAEAAQPVNGLGGAAPNADAEARPAEQPPLSESFIDPMPNTPQAMRDARQWVRWQTDLVNSKPSKVPYQVNGQKASSIDQRTWTDYRTAVTGAVINREQGVGFVLANGFTGVDFDGCRDLQSNEITDWAVDALTSLGDAYVEVSPSGTGVHAIVLGKVPGANKKFSLNPAIGYGDKVAIEFYDTARYFTVTGEPQFEEVGDVIPCDLTEAYNKAHALRAANPSPRNEKATAADAADSNGTQIERLGGFATTKYDIFTDGTVESTGDHHPFIISDGYGRLTYPGGSEADQSFMNVAAFVHKGDADAMWDEYVKSPLARPKWLNREADFRRLTIAKAIKWFEEKNLTPYTSQPAQVTEPQAEVQPVPTAAPTPTTTDITGEEQIPPYNPAIECGFFKAVVDAVCNGTTIPRQFMRNLIQAFVGAYVSDVLKFEDLDCNSSRYAVNIGTSGTSKRTVWNRGIANQGKGIFEPLINQDSDSSVKVFDGADSGAGLKDAFFEKPVNAPVLLLIDEAASLGNKSAETKQPEIVDAIIELADSTTVSRVKAKRSQNRKSAKSHDNARLSMYVCAQEGVVVTQAFAGRKKQGIEERLFVEYSSGIEPGNLPAIPAATKAELVNQLIRLKNSPQWKNSISMTDEAKQALGQYWASQPDAVRTKIRLRRNLMLDVYMRAFSRGENVATLEDLRLCAEHFERDKVIRRVHFRGDVPNKVGLYTERLKQITETMRAQLNRGLGVGMVAMSKRDLQTKTRAYADNELDFFDRALNVFGKAHLLLVKVTAANGQEYTKFIPMPYEEENWNLLPNSTQEFKP